ncbi:MAG: peptidoglycan bridge formation glycyltransferase FemA/FemB family protein, partial [Nitrospira sp.]|nr:peptidoglycan bridge formation glycyltransferase FemA/FemB family protein [Nitrospira sp.]
NASICAGVICSAIGSTALYLFGATSTAGVKSRGSYLLQWKQIEQLNKNRVPWYDLHGINPEENPGTYKFKSDLAGDHGRELRFVGQFEACESLLSKVCVRIGEALLSVGRSFVRN